MQNYKEPNQWINLKDFFLQNYKEPNQWINLKDWVRANNSQDQFGIFIQEDGKLIISNISYRAHGFYNCYPEGQKRVAEIIYEVHLLARMNNLARIQHYLVGSSSTYKHT